MTVHQIPNTLKTDAFWMPFTANRQFKANPRLLAKAKGVHYWTPEGRRIIDGTAGLWCVNAGHGRKPIVEAIQKPKSRTEARFKPFLASVPEATFNQELSRRQLTPADMREGLRREMLVQKVLEKEGNVGYNAATGKYEDPVKTGIIDPMKVTRTALQNAASIAALLLTTDAVVSEIKEKKKAAAA